MHKCLSIQRLAQLLVVQNATLLIIPVARHVLAWVAEGIGALHPYLFAFQCALELVQYTEFIVSAVDFGFTLDLLEDFLPPSGSDHIFDGNSLREMPTVAA
jgi:hypothetical protein